MKETRQEIKPNPQQQRHSASTANPLGIHTGSIAWS
jgi:hypothetical protein